MIDVACLLIAGVIVWCVAAEGIWGAAQTFLCVLLSGLLAMNFFEPLANSLDGLLGQAKGYSDIVSLLVLFTGFIFALRLGVEQLAPTFIQVFPMLDQFGRWVFAVLTGYLTMAVLLTSLHTAPLPREFLGFKAERSNFFGMCPDRQWLGFVQYVTEKPLNWYVYRDVPHAFDGRYEKLGDANSPFPNTIWPSFPIRYAMRRTQFGGGPAPTAASAAPQIILPPSGPAGSNNPGF